MRFTTCVMSVKNNIHLYVARTSRNRMSTTCDLYCCLLLKCEALRTCCSTFPITRKRCFDQDVNVVPGEPSQKERAIGSVHCKKEMLQPLSWRCFESVIHCIRGVRKQQHTKDASWTSNNMVISLGDLYCWLLPQCKGLCTCRSSFWSQHRKYTSLSFTCPICEKDQRWTCSWIWI